MAKVKFEKSGESYLLPEELYNLVLTKVEKIEKSEYWGYKFHFSVMDEEKLEQGQGTSLGKYLNIVFWANNNDKAKKVYKETGDFIFSPTGKFANACKALAKSKDIDVTSDDFDPETDLVGCICKGLTTNDTKDGDTYSNLDSSSIREATAKTQAAYQEWKAWKKAQKDRDADFKNDKKKPAEDAPKKKKPAEDDFEEAPVKKAAKKPVDDDDFEEAPVKKAAKKPVVDDDDDFDEAPPKKQTKKPVEEDEPPVKKAPKKPVDDDDDLFDD